MTISSGKVEPLKTFLGQYVFRVSEYQRGFEWTSENIEQFHKTVMSCVKDNSDHPRHREVQRLAPNFYAEGLVQVTEETRSTKVTR